ncbi:MAG: hypothetical protein A3K19_13710 [Lentisphaerae bacterium RIFOXYB12_FULL_65_16]|nr:MAG: hypothetical protein A3K18_00015 [Lentisphaerae bacterium RIFOXYA12_64_32]OGV84206.1 MAG: hypothetical protein A3K19_13710 [Lentisphaerae bacterium RIFOXYB12_FULL_65_16]
MKSVLRDCLVGMSVLGLALSSNAQQGPAPAVPAAPGPVVAPAQAAGNQVAANRAKLLELRQEKSRLFRSINELEVKLLQEKPELKDKLAKNQEEIKQLRDQEKQIQEQVQKLNQQRDQILSDASPELAQAHARAAQIDEEIRATASSPVSFRPTRDRMRVKPGAVGSEKPETAPVVTPAPADKAAEAPKPPEAPKVEEPKKE